MPFQTTEVRSDALRRPARRLVLDRPFARSERKGRLADIGRAGEHVSRIGAKFVRHTIRLYRRVPDSHFWSAPDHDLAPSETVRVGLVGVMGLTSPFVGKVGQEMSLHS